MPEIKFPTGTAVNHAAMNLAALANEHNDTYTCDFDGITMSAKPGAKPQHVLQDFWEEQERQRAKDH